MTKRLFVASLGFALLLSTISPALGQSAVPRNEWFNDPSSVGTSSGWKLVGPDGGPPLLNPTNNAPSWLGYSSTGGAGSGNPATNGFALFQDWAGDNSFIAAPGSFLGDWSGIDRIGAISFDHKIFLDEGYQANHEVRLEGPGGEAYWRIPGPIGVGGWKNVFADLREETWQIVRGSWPMLLENVTEFRIGIELSGGITGIDNVRVTQATPIVEYSPGPVLGRTGFCVDNPEINCDPNKTPPSCPTGACEPQVLETPTYAWSDCSQSSSQSCSISIYAGSSQTNFVTPVGTCRAYISTHDSDALYPYDGNFDTREVTILMALTPHVASGLMCCEWQISNCQTCRTNSNPNSTILSEFGDVPYFRWGSYASYDSTECIEPSDDCNHNGRPDPCEDPDNDGRPAAMDNCRNPNPTQIDSDRDGIGDHCDDYCNNIDPPAPPPTCTVPEPDFGVTSAALFVTLVATCRRMRRPQVVA